MWNDNFCNGKKCEMINLIMEIIFISCLQESESPDHPNFDLISKFRYHIFLFYLIILNSQDFCIDLTFALGICLLTHQICPHFPLTTPTHFFFFCQIIFFFNKPSALRATSKFKYYIDLFNTYNKLTKYSTWKPTSDKIAVLQHKIEKQ